MPPDSPRTAHSVDLTSRYKIPASCGDGKAVLGSSKARPAAPTTTWCPNAPAARKRTDHKLLGRKQPKA